MGFQAKFLSPEIFSCVVCLPQKLSGMGLIASMLVQVGLSGSSYIFGCSWRGRCRQIRAIDTKGRTNI